MATFQYRAKEISGNTVDGVIEAETNDDAVEKINRLGYLPVKVVEVSSSVSEKNEERSTGTKINFFSSGISAKEITSFSQQLARLLKSGVPILRAISIISEPVQNKRFKSLLQGIYEDVKNGKPLSFSLSKYPKYFPALYLALITAGESGGSLDQVLARITEHRQKQAEIISHIRSAMTYPILMAFTGVGAIIFMLTYVMPKLMGVFANLGGELPVPTKILINASNALRHQWGWILLVVGALILIFAQTRKSKVQRIALSAIRLKLPLVGSLTMKAEIARFANTIQLLLKSGVPIIKAIEVATPVLSNELLKKELGRCLQDLKEGGSFGKSLRQSKMFPLFMTNLILIGEEAGRLDETLSELAEFYERETNEAIRSMTSLIEPLMILVMGLIVGFIVIAMLLPIFEINMMVK